jgi:hypothetical protein
MKGTNTYQIFIWNTCYDLCMLKFTETLWMNGYLKDFIICTKNV